MADTQHPKRAVLMLSMDRAIFQTDSAVRKRMIEYGSIFSRLHIIVFSRRGHRLGPERIAENVWVHPTHSWSRLWYFFDTFRTVRRELVVEGELAIDVISAQEFEPGFIGLKLARKYKRTFQLQIHGDPWNPYSRKALWSNRMRLWLAEYVIPKVDCVRVVSRSVEEEIERRYPSLKGKTSLLPIHVDLTHFREAKPSFDLHARYPEFNFIILMVSRLAPEKNVPFAVDILADIVAYYPKVGLVIVGDMSNGSVKRRVLARARARRVLAHVKLEGRQDDLVSYYKGANLFLHTSKYEGYGMALVEAAACGLPIVTSHVGVAPSLDGTSDGAMVCPVDDRACFTKAIAGFLSDNTRRILSRFSVSYKLDEVTTPDMGTYLEAYRESIEKCL